MNDRFEQPDIQEDDQGLENEMVTTMSLLGGVGKSDDTTEPDLFGAASGASAQKRLSGGTLVLLLVFVLAAAAIYAMRLGQSDLNASAVTTDLERKIEKALVRLSAPQRLSADDPLRPENMSELFRDTSSIIDLFSRDMTENQVPISHLQMNPFMLPTLKEPEPKPVAKGDAQPVNDRREEYERQRLLTEASRLNLQSVITGARPMAIIDGQVIQVGKSVGSFVVKSIDHLSVTLESQGQLFRIKLAQ